MKTTGLAKSVRTIRNFFLSFAAAGLTHVALAQADSISIEALKSEMTAKGLPTSFEELETSYLGSPSEKNGAHLILAGIDYFKTDELMDPDIYPNFYNETFPSSGGFFENEEAAQEAADFFERNQLGLNLIRQGVEMEKIRYPIEMDKREARIGIIDITPAVNVGRTGFRLLRASCALNLQQGNGDLAVTDLLNIFRLADSLHDFPSAGSLFQHSGYFTGKNILENILTTGLLQENELLRIHNYFNSTENRYFMKDEGSFGGDIKGALIRWLDIELLQIREVRFDRLTGRDRFTPEKMREYVKSGALEQDLSFLVKHWIETIEIGTRLPIYDLNKKSRELNSEAKDHAVEREFIISNEYIGEDGAFGIITEGMARVRLSGTAVAVELYRLAHDNEVPDSLDLLVPDYLAQVPNDPFDGEPLRFRKLSGNSYRIYSIADDFRDDGGTNRRTSDDGFDIIFEVQR